MRVSLKKLAAVITVTMMVLTTVCTPISASANMGTTFKAATQVLKWDFEDGTDIIGSTSTEVANKWMYATKKNSGGWQAVEPVVMDVSDARADVLNNDDAVAANHWSRDSIYTGTEKKSVGSEKCVMLTMAGTSGPSFIGMKVKVSKNDLIPEKDYILSFYAKTDNTSRTVYTELLPTTTITTNSGDKGWYKTTYAVPWMHGQTVSTGVASIVDPTDIPEEDAIVTNYWSKIEIELNPIETDFDSDGYAYLYMMFGRNPLYKDVSGTVKVQSIYQFDQYYIDDIVIKEKPEEGSRNVSSAVVVDMVAEKALLSTQCAELEPDWSDVNGGVETEIGNLIYKNSSPEGTVSWSFEDDNEVTTSGGGAVADVNVWTDGSNFSNAETGEGMIRMIDINDVQDCNPNPGNNSSIASSGATDSVDKGNPAKGSTKCLVIENDSPSTWRPFLAAKVKISKSDVKLGVPYKLSFWHMNNSYGTTRGIWAEILPYSNTEAMAYNAVPSITGSLDLFDFSNGVTTTNPFDFEGSRTWKQYEMEFEFSDNDFADGYTTLWLITHRYLGYNDSKSWQYCAPNERAYFDNVMLMPILEEEEFTTYNLDAKVTADIGTTVTASIVIDGDRELLNVYKTSEDGSVTLNGNFTMGTEDEYIIGDDKGSELPADNDRVKLEITADGDITVETMTLSKAPSDEMKENGVVLSPLYLKLTIFSPIVQEIKSEELGSYINLTSGGNVYSNVYPDMNATLMSFIDADDVQLGNRVYDYNRFFSKGVELDGESPLLIKLSGAGRYFLEFKLNTEANEMLTISYGTAESEIEVKGAGTYGADIELTQEDIDAINNETVFTCSNTELSISDITLRKTAD